MKKALLERFLRYVKINTQSDENSNSLPSTNNQFDLANLLVEEFITLGLSNAYCNKHCYVFATLESNAEKDEPAIALFAHLDTSPEVSGENVRPQIIDCYQGDDIVLRKDPPVIIHTADNPHLLESIGHTIITTDGTTLLGSDDKAGIAAIMSTVAYLIQNPDIKHGDIRICFTPDEETGNGISNFDLSELNADFAYTIDGGFIGEINKETFSAESAIIEIKGVDMHPGYALDKLVNSTKILGYILSQLPNTLSPEHTCNYEPYIHPVKINGSVANSTINLILRDFTDEGLNKLHAIIEDIIMKAQYKFPKSTISISYKSTYKNMDDTLRKYPQITNRLESAVEESGITPIWKPIRGGTDGSKLSALGLPAPNIFTAACNAHSLTEWQSIDGLVKVVETLINLVKVRNEL